jgi:7-cyano-7-deazaguanine reductase
MTKKQAKDNPKPTRKSAQIAAFQPHDKTLPFKGEEAIDAAVLECFPYAYHGTPHGDAMEITTTTTEFTSVCPFSGLPDFAEVRITYTPRERCIELRSLKYYLLSYRDVGIWYEHLVNRMLEDLVCACEPQRMEIVIVCNPRGGLASTVRAVYDRSTMGAPNVWKKRRP